MQKLNLFTGGHPFSVDDLAIMQAGTIDALKGVCEGLAAGHDSFLIKDSGLNITGYIYFQGEIFPTDQQPLISISLGSSIYWVIDEQLLVPSPVNYQNGFPQNVHVRRRMRMVSASTPPANSILASSLLRLSQILGLTPTRGIIMYSGAVTKFNALGLGVAPELRGWALCNGNTHNIAGLGAITTPDLRGRFVVGLDKGNTTPVNPAFADPLYSSVDINNRPNGIGGKKTVTLTSAEIPTHTHPLSANGQIAWPATSGSTGAANGSTTAAPTPGALPNIPLTGNTDANIGGGGAHENRPPFLTLAFIIKLV